MAKQISFGLSVKKVERAKSQLESYRAELYLKINALVERLTDEGANIARLKVVEMKAFYTGALESSIGGYFSPSTGVGIIYAGTVYAVYVELGTGVVGKANQHPAYERLGWVYDVNEHGDSGWWYPTDDPKLIRYTAPSGATYGWTKGMPSRPFMYETARHLESICATLAKEVFKE